MDFLIKLIIFMCNEIIDPIMKAVYSYVLKPCFVFCVNYGIFEMMAYLFCLTLINEGKNMPSPVGFYFSISGVLLLPIAIKNTKTKVNDEIGMALEPVYFILYAISIIPIAVMH